MSTQITTAEMGSLSDGKAEGLRIPDALKAAIMRKISRLAGMREELDKAGWTHLVTSSELYLLEAEGFIVDFDTGTCIDTIAEVTS